MNAEGPQRSTAQIVAVMFGIFVVVVGVIVVVTELLERLF